MRLGTDLSTVPSPVSSSHVQDISRETLLCKGWHVLLLLLVSQDPDPKLHPGGRNKNKTALEAHQQRHPESQPVSCNHQGRLAGNWEVQGTWPIYTQGRTEHCRGKNKHG